MKKTIISAALAFGLAASASAASTLYAANDAAVTTQYVWDTTATPSLTASSAGVLSHSPADTNWIETTVTFTLDFKKIAADTLTDGFHSLVAISTSRDNTVGIGVLVSTENEVTTKTYYMQWGNSEWSGKSFTLPENTSGTYSLVTQYGLKQDKPSTFLYDSGAETPVAIFDTVGLGSTNNSAYTDEVTVNSAYVKQFAVSNAALKLDSTGIGAVASVVPEPATATLSLLALAGLAARRRRK